VIITETGTVFSPALYACENCQKCILFRESHIAKTITSCEECGFDITFEDLENIYDSSSAGSFELAASSLSKGHFIGFIHGCDFSILAPSSHPQLVDRLHAMCEQHLPHVGVFISEQRDFHTQHSGLPISPPTDGGVFTLGKDICSYTVQTSDSILLSSPPRTVVELILYRLHDAPLLVVSGSLPDMNEWDIKTRLHGCVDYFLVRS